MQSVSSRKLALISLICGCAACGRLALAQVCVLPNTDNICHGSGTCCVDSSCMNVCAEPLKTGSNPIMPGFLVQTTGRRTVALVIPRSPAAAGGMLSGDEIV